MLASNLKASFTPRHWLSDVRTANIAHRSRSISASAKLRAARTANVSRRKPWKKSYAERKSSKANTSPRCKNKCSGKLERRWNASCKTTASTKVRELTRVISSLVQTLKGMPKREKLSVWRRLSRKSTKLRWSKWKHTWGAARQIPFSNRTKST